MLEEYPQYIYHYCSYPDFITYICPGRNLKFLKYTGTKDPFENMHWWFGIKEDSISTENYFLVNTAITAIYDYIGLICFSMSDENMEGCLLPRMWAQYGDGFKGVCLKIDVDKLINENSKQLNNEIYGNRVKYDYDLKYPEIDTDSANLDIHKYALSFTRENYNSLFFIKHKDWSGEREYRIIKFGAQNDYLNIKDSVEEVIIGLHCTKEIAEAANKYFNGKIYQLTRSAFRLKYDKARRLIIGE